MYKPNLYNADISMIYYKKESSSQFRGPFGGNFYGL